MSNTTLNVATAFHRKTKGLCVSLGPRSRGSKAVQPPVGRARGKGRTTCKPMG